MTTMTRFKLHFSAPSGSWATSSTSFVDVDNLLTDPIDLKQGDYVEAFLIGDTAQPESYFGISGNGGGVAGTFRLVGGSNTGPTATFGSHRVRLDNGGGWNLSLPPGALSFAFVADTDFPGLRLRVQAMQNASHGGAAAHHVRLVVKVFRPN